MSLANTDHVRHGDEITLDAENEVMTRPVRTKYIPKSMNTVTSAFPLQPKKNRKGKKKPIEWPDDPEMKAQGQDADCGENLSSLDESALMDCEFRDDALGKKQDFKKTMKKANSHWFDCYTRDIELLKSINSVMDFSYLAVGLRGSGCTRDIADHTFTYPPHTCLYHSIQDEKGHAALNFGK